MKKEPKYYEKAGKTFIVGGICGWNEEEDEVETFYFYLELKSDTERNEEWKASENEIVKVFPIKQ